MYANGLMGAAAVICDAAGRVLLVKQTYGDCNWALPGGYTEPHESIVETAVREVREETGLQVVADWLNGIYYGAATRLPSLRVSLPHSGRGGKATSLLVRSCSLHILA